MAKTYVLDRVAADLARGFTHPAIQRLSSLVAEYPNDLDLRRRLAAVHRRVGNRIQAGRWDYLTIGADARDTRAFERAFPSAVARLREVRWPYRASEAATAYARRRLAKLIAAAEQERPGAPPRATVHRRIGAAQTVGAQTVGAQAVGAQAVGTRAGRSPDQVGARPGLARGVRGAARMARAARQWWPFTRYRRPVTVASVASAPFVVVGMVTVVEWFVQ